MPVYIVGFDVRNASSADAYGGLQNAVAKLERHRLMPWLYLVSVPFTAGALKEYLLNHMSDADRLWISRLPPRARFEFAYQTTGGTSAWLRKHSRIEVPTQPSSAVYAEVARRDPKNVIAKQSDAAKTQGENVRYAAIS